MDIATHKFVCPCCGYQELDRPPYERMGLPPWLGHGTPPYSLRYGTPSYDVCACCGFEFGNDDEPGTAPPETFAAYLCRWIAGGCDWFTPNRKPEGWSLKEQLKRAAIPYDERMG